MSIVGFLHTSPVHMPTFEGLVGELAPEVGIRTCVDEVVLAIARDRGVDIDEVRSGVVEAIEMLVAGGADLVVCTCSTIGRLAEQVGTDLGVRVVRVDRPMAEAAVASGGSIVVLAALASTVAPTRSLIESIAAEQGADVELEVRVVDGAWERFEDGDLDGYLDLIAGSLVALADRCDLVVLAQASMAPVTERVDLAIPVLSSPRLAVEMLLA